MELYILSSFFLDLETSLIYGLNSFLQSFVSNYVKYIANTKCVYECFKYDDAADVCTLLSGYCYIVQRLASSL